MREIETRNANGIGTAFLGCAELRPDGSRVSTKFLTFLFLPLLPIATGRVRFLGRKDEGHGAHGAFTSSRYALVEKLPLRWKQVLASYLLGWVLAPLALVWPVGALV